MLALFALSSCLFTSLKETLHVQSSNVIRLLTKRINFISYECHGYLNLFNFLLLFLSLFVSKPGFLTEVCAGGYNGHLPAIDAFTVPWLTRTHPFFMLDWERLHATVTHYHLLRYREELQERMGQSHFFTCVVHLVPLNPTHTKIQFEVHKPCPRITIHLNSQNTLISIF